MSVKFWPWICTYTFGLNMCISLVWWIRWTRKCGPPFWLWSGSMVSRWMPSRSGNFWLWRLRCGFMLRMVTAVLIKLTAHLLFLTVCRLKSDICPHLVFSVNAFFVFLFQQHVWQSVWKLEMFCWVATCKKKNWASGIYVKLASPSGWCTGADLLNPTVFTAVTFYHKYVHNHHFHWTTIIAWRRHDSNGMTKFTENFKKK